MTWYIYKGEDLKRDQIIKFKFFQTIKLHHHPNDLIFYGTLRYSEREVAPDYPGALVKTACEVRADLRGVDKKFFRARTGSGGQACLDVDFSLVLHTAAANLKFSLEVAGKELGSVDATYV